jgi:hypothetical protein
MTDVTICFTYFKSLTLANLRASLFSVRQQDFSRVAELVFFDNDTVDSEEAIHAVIESFDFPVPVLVLSDKHGDPTRAQSWSTNATVRLARTKWVFYTRADYLLDFGILRKFVEVIDSRPPEWSGFITSNGCHLANVIEECEATNWRAEGPSVLHGIEYDYTSIDSGVWMLRKDAYDEVRGFDESLSAWGHAQTLFQYTLFRYGTDFVRVPETLFRHPFHGGARDMSVANAQLAEHVGIDIRQMWARYHGTSPYGEA